MRNSGLPRLVVLAVILVVTGFAIVGYEAFRKDVAAMRSASQEDITWTAFQLEQELGRFLDSLNRFQITNSNVNSGDVNSRFDILWSRIAVFQQGHVGERLAHYDRETQIVSRLFDNMKVVDRQIVSLSDGDNVSASALYASFKPFAVELREFSRLVTLGEETRGRGIREQLQGGVNRTLLLGMLAIAITLASLAYINRESLRFRRLAETNLKLADKAEKASRVKTQFLTMMSHELRTPMNGVLGLLALAKKDAAQPEQTQMIEAAERSGKQMVVLLADILDFSALQSDDLELHISTFEIDELATFLREYFAPMAEREGIPFEVSVANDCPKKLSGDFRRIRQAVGHLVQYILDTAGIQKAELAFGCEDNKLQMSLSFEYMASGGEWTPELILGTEERDGETFASDALGPSIARGFIGIMRGGLQVEACAKNRMRVVATVPVEIVDSSRVNVAVLSATGSLRAICRAALSSDDVVVLQEDDESLAQLVLIESGNADETELVARSRAKYPDAVLGALGTPSNPEAFEFTASFPLDFAELRKMVAQINA